MADQKLWTNDKDVPDQAVQASQPLERGRQHRNDRGDWFGVALSCSRPSTQAPETLAADQRRLNDSVPKAQYDRFMRIMRR